MDRRQLLVSGGKSVVVGAALAAMESIRRRGDSTIDLPVTSHEVDEWDRVADRHALRVSRYPTNEVLPELLTDYEDVHAQAGAANSDLVPRLLRVCAQLSALTAVTLLTSGFWPQAERFWRQAQKEARWSGDQQLLTMIAGRRAIFSIYGPDHRVQSTLAIAREAASASGGTPSVGAASAYGAQAQALALAGDRSGAHVALAKLESVCDRLTAPSASDVQTEWTWHPRRLYHTQSFVYSYTGDISRASAAQDTALSMYPSAGSLGAAQVRFHQAACMIASGDPRGGASYAAQVFESVPPGFRGGDMRAAGMLVLDSLPDQAKHLPDVREVRALISSASV